MRSTSSVVRPSLLPPTPVRRSQGEVGSWLWPLGRTWHDPYLDRDDTEDERQREGYTVHGRRAASSFGGPVVQSEGPEAADGAEWRSCGGAAALTVDCNGGRWCEVGVAAQLAASLPEAGGTCASSQLVLWTRLLPMPFTQCMMMSSSWPGRNLAMRMSP